MAEVSDLTSEHALPPTWTDALPWLAWAADPAEGGWWNEPIDDSDPESRHGHLSTVSSVAMGRLRRWTIGQIFPGLTPNVDLLALNMPVRAIHVLDRLDYGTSSKLITVTPDDMLDWRQVGVGTVDAILRAVADFSTSTTSLVAGPQSQASELLNTSVATAPASLPDWVSAVVDDLSQIAQWYATIGTHSQAILGEDLPLSTPVEVTKARQRIEGLRASDILTAGLLELDVASRFDRAIGLLDVRAREILGRRLFADARVTLDEIGKQYDITRERVRQIEATARGELMTFISEQGLIAAVASSARELIGTVRPLDDLLELIPSLAKNVESIGQPAWRILDRLDDAYEIESGWCAVPTMTSAITITHAQLQEHTDQYGVAHINDLDILDTSPPDRRGELTAAWLHHCGYIIDSPFVLTRTSSVQDYAASILAIEGSPLSTQEILDRFVVDRSARSLGNSLSSDDRFERVDRDRWALKEWGLEAYGGIRSKIRELVAQGGGRAPLGEIVEYITARYNVSGSSVVAYASAIPFTTKDGIVQRATAGRNGRKPPERTKRLFRRPDGWAYRVRISTEHQRGSSTVAPTAIATILDLPAGQTVQLDSVNGPQAIAWTGLQPTFGTIRRFLLDDDIAADSELFLVIHDDRTLTFEPMRALGDNPLLNALSLIGAPETVDRETARLALARALRIPDESPVISIIGAYRERGDEDIADLALSAREYLETGREPGDRNYSADIDDILDLL